jgi:hypothetical protein
MAFLVRAADYAMRLTLNICLWLLMPILAILNFALILALGIAGIAGAVCYGWFMWGVAMLIFYHGPHAVPQALHMMAAGGLRMIAAGAAVMVFLAARVTYEALAKWLERGGFLIPRDAPFNTAEAIARRYAAPARWDLWARFMAWRARRFLARNPQSLEFSDTTT